MSLKVFEVVIGDLPTTVPIKVQAPTKVLVQTDDEEELLSGESSDPSPVKPPQKVNNKVQIPQLSGMEDDLEDFVLPKKEEFIIPEGVPEPIDFGSEIIVPEKEPEKLKL